MTQTLTLTQPARESVTQTQTQLGLLVRYDPYIQIYIQFQYCIFSADCWIVTLTLTLTQVPKNPLTLTQTLTQMRDPADPVTGSDY